MGKEIGELPLMLTRPPSPSQPIFRNFFGDYRIAKHYLDLQERAKRIYELRRHHFYLITVVHNEKRPTHTFFMDKNTHIHSDEKRLPQE